MTPDEATKKYRWIKYDPATNTIDMYLDHYMLSGLRTCESRFYLQHIALITPRYEQGLRKPWFLDFGEYVHWCLEIFYNEFKNNQKAPELSVWIDHCKEHWQIMKMDEYKDHHLWSERYEQVGGWEGVCGLLIEYYAFYMNMRLRVIDTEITFGHNKEVFLGSYYSQDIKGTQGNIAVNCYLTGRIDLLVDNGYKIGPIDHKTSHKFRGTEHDNYNPQDALTGYILACHEIMKLTQPEIAKTRPVLSSWIQHISACRPSIPRDKSKSPGPRFKTTPVDKTIEQLEEFKQRQVSTFKRIAALLFNDETPQWNTMACNNIFMHPCEYKPIHESPSSQWVQIIQNHYDVGKSWDTRDYGTNASQE